MWHCGMVSGNHFHLHELPDRSQQQIDWAYLPLDVSHLWYGGHHLSPFKKTSECSYAGAWAYIRLWYLLWGIYYRDPPSPHCILPLGLHRQSIQYSRVNSSGLFSLLGGKWSALRTDSHPDKSTKRHMIPLEFLRCILYDNASKY